MSNCKREDPAEAARGALGGAPSVQARAPREQGGRRARQGPPARQPSKALHEIILLFTRSRFSVTRRIVQFVQRMWWQGRLCYL